MSEISSKNKLCTECESEIRPDSMFCYHCGEALETEVSGKTEEPSDVWFRGDMSPSKDKQEDEDLSDKSDVDQKNNDTSEDNKAEQKTEETNKKLEEKEEEKTENEASKNKANQIKPKPYKEKSKTKSSRGRYSRKTSKKSSKPKLKTASNSSNKERPSRLKKVEISWEDRENSPNFWFVIFALLLSLFVGVMIVVAFYLK